MWFFDPSADLIVGPPPLRGQTLPFRRAASRWEHWWCVRAVWLGRACRRDGIPASRAARG